MISPRLEHFGTSPNDEIVNRVEIVGGGLRAKIMTWGATLQDLRLEGFDFPLILGSEELTNYFQSLRNCGAIVGPVANRISNGQAELQGEMLNLDRNERKITTLHGGFQGLSLVNWQFDEIHDDSCVLAYTFKDLQGGFRGNLNISVEYSLRTAGALTIILRAQTDRTTFCNLAHHGYWNLDGSENLQDHKMKIFAHQYLPIDDNKIPLGAPQAVEDGRFDYLEFRPIWQLGETHLDHNFCLDASREALQPACTLRSEDIELNVFTTEPGLQVYDGYMLNTAPNLGLNGTPYQSMAGIALEPQKWPDAPNQPSYPSILITPESPYYQRSEFYIRPRQ